jgi:hypothetical protein
MHHAIVATTNHRTNPALDVRNPRAGAHRSSPSRNRTATTAAAVAESRYAESTNRVLFGPLTGMNRMSALMRLSCETPARNIIAEIAAEFTPTTCGL